MAAPWGLSTPRAPKYLFPKLQKSNLVTKSMFFLRIYTIFCMSEAVTISNGSRILPCPLGPLNALKTKIYFWAHSPPLFFILLESPWGYRSLVPPWGHVFACATPAKPPLFPQTTTPTSGTERAPSYAQPCGDHVW